MKINASDLGSSTSLKLIRQKSKLSQEEFAKVIGKSKDWVYSNEVGRSRYYFEDLLDIANKFNYEVVLIEKEKTTNTF